MNWKAARILLASAMALMGSSGQVFAQSVPLWLSAKITKIYADPSDVVLELGSNGPCGSNLFHIRRSATNFQEMTALMYTAAATGRFIDLYITSCDGQRNIISHGAAQFP